MFKTRRESPIKVTIATDEDIHNDISALSILNQEGDNIASEYETANQKLVAGNNYSMAATVLFAFSFITYLAYFILGLYGVNRADILFFVATFYLSGSFSVFMSMWFIRKANYLLHSTRQKHLAYLQKFVDIMEGKKRMVDIIPNKTYSIE